MTAIEYNIVEAHYLIAELRDEVERLTNQCDSYKEGLRDYAESDYWRQSEYMAVNKTLEQYVDDAERDYTLEQNAGTN